ncbi:restriction endonuclease subunit S [Roseibium sp.]|uniref:restriction endonuclease subunit S n=1 Tax=Roseibium sp. TaxID=1936156 RepID=UPI003A968BA4
MSWPLRSLSEVGKINTGSTPKTSDPALWGGDLPFVTPGELGSFDPIVSAARGLTDQGASKARTVPQNSILVCCIGSLGKTGIAGRNLVTNQQINSISFDEQYVYPRYGLYACARLAPALQSVAPATTVPIVNKTEFSKLKIPLPPLDEQRRIAAILDKADSLRQKRKQAIALLDSLTQSIFLEMFGDPASNPKGFPTGCIGDLLESVSYGTSAKAGTQGAFPILRMGNVTRSGQIDLSDLKYIDLEGKEIEKYTVGKGDILFNRTNSAELVGKTAVFDRDEPYAFAGYLVRARVRSGITPEYISGYLNSTHGKATLRGMAKSIVGMANINAKEMQLIPILIPDGETQLEFVKRIESVTERKAQMLPALEQANDLFASLQHRAFAGEL